MYDVQLSQGTYELAASAARAEKVSVDQYIDTAVQDAAIQRMFTPERLALIAQADAEIDAGKFLTTDQVREQLRKRHAEWVERHPS